jgi:hypothetical protein
MQRGVQAALTQQKNIWSHLRTAGLVLACAIAAVSSAAEHTPPVARIRFARGASSAEVHGAVVRGERALYSVEAREGQHMSLRITSIESNAVFQVYAPGAEARLGDASALEIAGQALTGAREGDDATRWTGVLPRSGPYLLVVGATRGNTTYRLTVKIR